MLKEHEKKIQQAVRKAHLDKAKTNRDYNCSGQTGSLHQYGRNGRWPVQCKKNLSIQNQENIPKSARRSRRYDKISLVGKRHELGTASMRQLQAWQGLMDQSCWQRVSSTSLGREEWGKDTMPGLSWQRSRASSSLFSIFLCQMEPSDPSWLLIIFLGFMWVLEDHSHKPSPRSGEGVCSNSVDTNSFVQLGKERRKERILASSVEAPVHFWMFEKAEVVNAVVLLRLIDHESSKSGPYLIEPKRIICGK